MPPALSPEGWSGLATGAPGVRCTSLLAWGL